MHFVVLIICMSSFFANANNDDLPAPVEKIHTGSGDVFCLFAYSRWAKLSIMHDLFFPSAQRVGIARLPNHGLDFKYYLEELKGSISTIAPDCGYEVWGAIYYIPMKDLDLVLAKGGVIKNKRILHFVQNSVEAYFNGQECAAPVNLKCNSFQQIDLPKKLMVYGLPLPENQRPSKQILDTMVDAFTDAGLPQEYINQVSQIPVRAQDPSVPYTTTSKTN